MASLPPEALAAALSAAHSAGAKGATAPTGPDPSQADPSQGDPSQGQDPNADPSQGAADPQHQALWSLFPSTDPSWLQGLVSQGGDPADAIGQAFQQRESDLAQFTQMQDSLMAHLAALFGAPSGGGQDMSGGAPPQSPGVGGAGSGY